MTTRKHLLAPREGVGVAVSCKHGRQIDLSLLLLLRRSPSTLAIIAKKLVQAISTQLVSLWRWASGFSVVEVLAGFKVPLEPRLDVSSKPVVWGKILVWEVLVSLGISVVDVEPGLNGVVFVAVAGGGEERV